ncbi:hypothetical protein K1T71_014419 [Dendrolimus kikuchii]|uniref:Uncharacterized protein n=1 Tax=Dendrolimus kikuchii TaxID=765133 RepID=A0ACC1CE72_9NEOP|nr:hypothetical protein K1T71_014419 [Dendrolimus kikuchii]
MFLTILTCFEICIPVSNSQNANPLTFLNSNGDTSKRHYNRCSRGCNGCCSGYRVVAIPTSPSGLYNSRPKKT